MTTLNFRKPTLDEYGHYKKYYRECLQLCSESSFWAIWEMVDTMEAERAFYKDYYWHKVVWHGKQLWMPPIGDWDAANWEELLTEVVPKGTLFGMPEYLVKKWMASFPQKIGILEPMDSESDYIYNIDRQVALKGQEYSSVRSDVHRFDHAYGDRSLFRAIEPADIPDIINFQNRWMQENYKLGKVCEDIEIEHQMILNMLDHWPLQDMIGAVLFVDEKIVGYVVASELDTYAVEAHTLKADYSYKGIYQYMLTQLYNQFLQGYALINAWGDGGVEGLRRCKQAQNPVAILKKFLISWEG